MKIINLFGGPGAGKSTVAAGLFHEMKMQGYNVELVTEYAKDMTWEGRDNILGDQLYILAKQNRRMSRLEDKIDFVITDSPLLFGEIYVRYDYLQTFKALLFELFCSYDNYNFLLSRPDVYAENGRNQTLEEAKVIDELIIKMLGDRRVEYDILPTNMDDIIAVVLESIK